MENTNEVEKELEKNEAVTEESPIAEAEPVNELKKLQDEVAEAKNRRVEISVR